MSIDVVIRTAKGYFLTAVDGGGRTTNVLHSDAVRVGAPDPAGHLWELFTLEQQGDGLYIIRTSDGHLLTAMDGGGRVNDVIHSDATDLGAPDPAGHIWEKFAFERQEDGSYAIRTTKGNYLTAVDGGGRVNDVIHTDATSIGMNPTTRVSWEKFWIIPLL